MSPDPDPVPVVVAGSGVGAIEAVLALREFAGNAVPITLVSPDEEYVHRPMAVAEPFGAGTVTRVPLRALALSHGIEHVRARVTAVDGDRHVVRLDDGTERSYRALVVATGARGHEWLPGALHFAGPRSVPAMRDLLDRVAAGDVTRLVFAAPPAAGWTLPVYELALLTSAWLADRGLGDVRLALVTPELQPLSAFGRAARRLVRSLLADRGITLVAAAEVRSFDGDAVSISTRPAVPADAVVTLPRLLGAGPAGLPADRDGFVPVGRAGTVEGAPDVHVVGDLAVSALKQGGLAAQAADVAAAAIARSLGVAVPDQPEEPVVRGLLLTGVAPAYFAGGDAALHPLWKNPGKVAGRHLSAYLDEPATSADAMRHLALDLARADADAGDRPSALRWLETVDWLDDGAPHPDVEALRSTWRPPRPVAA